MVSPSLANEVGKLCPKARLKKDWSLPSTREILGLSLCNRFETGEEDEAMIKYER